MNQEVGACQETDCIPKRKYSMEDLREIYSTQFSISNVENLSIEAALHHIGTLIDLSLDLGEKDGLRKAIQLSKDLQHHCLSIALSKDHQYGMAFLSIFSSSNRRISV